MKIQKIVFILFSIVFWSYAENLSAQEQYAADSSKAEAVKAELFKEVNIDTSYESYKPQWQKGFDAMRMKSNEEMARSLKLSIEQKDLERQIEKLSREYETSQNNNQELQTKIEGQEGITDDKKWKAKTAETERILKDEQAAKNKELAQSRKDMKLLQDKIDVIRLKLKMMGVEDLSDARFALQQERNFLEAKIITNDEKLKDLSEKIDAIKSRGLNLDPKVAQAKAEIESLRKDLGQLEDQQKALTGASGLSLADTIEVLRRQKIDVQKSSDEVKAKVLKYRSSQKMGIENNQIKKLVEAISAVDSANMALNDEISDLTENITILKVRIKRMEYKTETVKALKDKPQEKAR